MNTLLMKWTQMSRELVEVAEFIYGPSIRLRQKQKEEVIRLSFDPKHQTWMCTCELSTGLECVEKGDTSEEALRKGLFILELKLAEEKEKIRLGKYYLYGFEEV